MELLHERGGVELPLVALHPAKVLGSPPGAVVPGRAPDAEDHAVPRHEVDRGGAWSGRAPEASELRFSTSLAKLGDSCMAGCSAPA